MFPPRNPIAAWLLYLDSQLHAGHLSEIDNALLETIASAAGTLLDNALMLRPN